MGESFANRLGKKMGVLGGALSRVKNKGKLKLDEMEARSHLDARHRELGKAIADRALDHAEVAIELEDVYFKDVLRRIREARVRLAEVQERMLEIDAEGSSPPSEG